MLEKARIQIQSHYIAPPMAALKKRSFRALATTSLVQILFSVALVLNCFTDIIAQTRLIYNIDSLKKVLSTDLSDTNRIWALNNLARNIRNTDSIPVLTEEAIILSRKVGFVKGEAEAYNSLALWFNQNGNYPKALENYLRSIKLSESINYKDGLKRSFNSISTVYLYLQDYGTSINYARKARKLSIELNDQVIHAVSSSWLSKSFIELHRGDSALKYAQESYEIANRTKAFFPLYLATARLGEIHATQGNAQLALEYLRLSLNFSKKDGRVFRIAGMHLELAEVFKSAGMMDSCRWHARQAFSMSQSNNLMASLLGSSLLLSELYEGKNDKESLRFHKIALTAKDSLFSQDKNMQVELLNLNEAIRLQEIEEVRQQLETERKINLQYAGIALSLVLFIIVFLLLSHSLIANETLIRFLGILALLIVFEFINLLLHPLIGNLTHHSPLLMLGAMVCIAALIIPIHHRLEKLVTHKLIEKNKEIKLVAAKKIVEALDKGNS
jgi:tetratricopeptide (TPR) repeat protein